MTSAFEFFKEFEDADKYQFFETGRNYLCGQQTKARRRMEETQVQ